MGRHLDSMHKKILESLVSTSGLLVLEAGIGTGRFATWLAKKNFRVVGADISKEMLKKAKKKALALNVDVDLVMADLQFLPFRSQLFDSCYCINVIDHIPNISKFLNEARYVTKSEGFLIFNFSNLCSPYLPIAFLINLRKRALFSRGRIYSKWFTFYEIDVLLSRAKFSVDKVRGCMIASPLPFGNKLVRIVRSINLSSGNSRLRLLSGSIFVKTQPSQKDSAIKC